MLNELAHEHFKHSFCVGKHYNNRDDKTDSTLGKPLGSGKRHFTLRTCAYLHISH